MGFSVVGYIRAYLRFLEGKRHVSKIVKLEKWGRWCKKKDSEIVCGGGKL